MAHNNPYQNRLTCPSQTTLSGRLLFLYFVMILCKDAGSVLLLLGPYMFICQVAYEALSTLHKIPYVSGCSAQSVLCILSTTWLSLLSNTLISCTPVALKKTLWREPYKHSGWYNRENKGLLQITLYKIVEPALGIGRFKLVITGAQ